MPKVPAYTQQVTPDGLPSARITAVPSPDAFGASAGQAIGRSVAHIALTEQQHADEIAAMSLSNDFATLKQSMRDTIRSRKGQGAFTLPEELQPEWEKQAGQLRTKARTGRQQQFADELTQRGWQDVNAEMQVHIDREKTQYDREQHDAYQLNQYNEGIAQATQPQLAGESVEQYAARVADGVVTAAANAAGGSYLYSARNGEATDVADAKAAQARSAIYASAIMAQTNAGNDLSAKELHKRFGDRIVGDDKVRIEKTLEIASTRGEAQRQADDILAASGDDQEAALARVKEISDPNVRALSHDLVRQEFHDRKVIRQEKLAELYDTAEKAIHQSGGNYAAGVSAEVEAQLTGRQLTALDEYAKAIRNDAFPDDGAPEYFSTRRLAMDPATYEAFFKELPLNRAKMSRGNYAELQKLGDDIIKQKAAKDGKPGKTYGGIYTRTQVIDQAIRDLDYDPKKNGPGGEDQEPVVLRFYGMLDKAVAAEQDKQDKELTGDQVKEIVDRLMVEQAVTRQRSALWAALPFGFLREGTYSENVPAFTLPNADKIAYTRAQIPDAEQAEIADAFQRRKNRPPTDAEMIAAYNAQLGRANAE